MFGDYPHFTEKVFELSKILHTNLGLVELRERTLLIIESSQNCLQPFSVHTMVAPEI